MGCQCLLGGENACFWRGSKTWTATRHACCVFLPPSERLPLLDSLRRHDNRSLQRWPWNKRLTHAEFLGALCSQPPRKEQQVNEDTVPSSPRNINCFQVVNPRTSHRPALMDSQKVSSPCKGSPRHSCAIPKKNFDGTFETSLCPGMVGTLHPSKHGGKARPLCTIGLSNEAWRIRLKWQTGIKGNVKDGIWTGLRSQPALGSMGDAKPSQLPSPRLKSPNIKRWCSKLNFPSIIYRYLR